MNKYVSPSLEIMDLKAVNIIMASFPVVECPNQMPLSPASLEEPDVAV